MGVIHDRSCEAPTEGTKEGVAYRVFCSIKSAMGPPVERINVKRGSEEGANPSLEDECNIWGTECVMTHGSGDGLLDD